MHPDRRILVAEDDDISRRLVTAMLHRLDYEVIEARDGDEAWSWLSRDDPPRLALVDWMMPGIDGLELCRRVRSDDARRYIYMVILTSQTGRDAMIDSFEAGADDYLAKPFDPHELVSRLTVGRRILDLQLSLRDKLSQLEQALTHVKQLQGLLPICMHCKQIRDDADTWHQLESYIERNTEALFTHTLCLGCMKEHYPDQYARKYGDAAPSEVESESR